MNGLRRALPVALLIVFGIAFGLALLEAGTRVLAVQAERQQGRLDRDVSRLKPPQPGSVVTLGQIIRRSDLARVVYELRPRLDVIFAGARLSTSDAGHRGADVVGQKPISTFRIVGIGDSYMFGQGVADDETYLARLSGPTVDLLSGRQVETVNLAVPGYNTVMEVETLRARAEALRPDLVLIEIVGNDLDLPNFLWTEVDPWTLRRSFLLEFVGRRLGGLTSPSSPVGGLSEAPQESESAARTFARESGDVPPQYASMVGLPAFEGAIREVAEWGRTRGIPVRALTHGVWFEDEMLRTLAANDIPVLLLRSALRQRARKLGAPDYARSALALSATDLHPSALGHQAIADELAAWLKTVLPGPRTPPE
ncbi:MAG: SGNH/GDSL hydrolase family protein [Vicinamibacteria bacterium]|nr:SGNH/GDSL hydrolase family protein [Vicinamibacteria bacterium]